MHVERERMLSQSMFITILKICEETFLPSGKIYTLCSPDRDHVVFRGLQSDLLYGVRVCSTKTQSFTVRWKDHCIQGNIRPRFILALVASGQIPMSQNYLYFTQLCFGEFNLRQGNTVWKCRWAKITRGENNLVYSINQIKSNDLDFI